MPSTAAIWPKLRLTSWREYSGVIRSPSVDVAQGVGGPQARGAQTADRAGDQAAEQGEADRERDQAEVDGGVERDLLGAGRDSPPGRGRRRRHRPGRAAAAAPPAAPATVASSVGASALDQRGAADPDQGAGDAAERALQQRLAGDLADDVAAAASRSP